MSCGARNTSSSEATSGASENTMSLRNHRSHAGPSASCCHSFQPWARIARRSSWSRATSSGFGGLHAASATTAHSGAHPAAPRVMQVPMDITFKDCEVSDALELRILQQATKLERIYDRITRCEVAVEHHKRTYRARVRLTVPGGEIVATSPHSDE